MITEPTMLTRVKKAYEQVAEQLREAIVRGEFEVGERLPKEMDLADMLGVSRATVREALRVLTSENLIRTTKGATGGSFIIRPSLDYVSEFMITQINLLTAADEVTIAETVELRELIETEATRLAATRRTADQLERLRATVPDDVDTPSRAEVTALNRAFHLSILELTQNRLMLLSAQPVYAVLEAHSRRHDLGVLEHREIVREHQEILSHIASGDGDAAAEAMREHLVQLRPLTEGTWSERGLT